MTDAAITMKTYYVISHTHWDREWYRPLAVMRHHLTDMMDHLLQIYQDYPDYVFHLDAQTICLEDYLDIRPQRRAVLEQLVRTKKLLIGPWYVQNDFFLTSGEATVRNLLTGRRIANAFGHCEAIGYVPDQFGLIGQLPQILRGFGIDTCIFARGYDTRGAETPPVPQPNEFLWAAPDGSEVLGVFLSAWYNNAQRFSADPAKALKYLRQAGADIGSRSLTPNLLMMNGVDHLEAQEDLLPILDALNRRLPAGETVRQSTMTDFLAAVRAFLQEHPVPLRRLTGEMRHGGLNNLLQGTLSGWTPIKRRNVEAQALLELQAEPESVMLSAFTGVPADLDYPRYLWKKLIENHPHDTICACSHDRVQEDAINRLDNVISGTADLIGRTRQALLERLDRRHITPTDYLIAVFNPLPFDRSATIAAKLHLPVSEAIDRVRIVGPDGGEAPFETLSVVRRKKATLSPINLPGMIEVMETDILLRADRVPACGYRVYRVLPGDGQILRPSAGAAPGQIVENDALKVEISTGGRVDITDKIAGLTYPDVIGFTDETDTGTAYNFQPATPGDLVRLETVARCQTRVVESRRLRQTVVAEYAFERPVRYDFAASCGCAESVTNRLTACYSLTAGSSHLDVEFRVENRSAHHRLRVVVRTGIASDLTTASTAFDLVDRCRAAAHHGDQPNNGVVACADDVRQMTIFNVGLHEYEHGDHGDIALTLLRSFTTINDHDKTGTPETFADESEDFSCPKSAMIGDYRLRAALRPGRLSHAAMQNEYHAFLAPLAAVSDAADNHKFCGGRPCVQDSTLQELFFRDLPSAQTALPLENGLLRLEGRVVVSALKPAEDGSGYVLRLFNPEAQAEPVHLWFSIPPSAATMVSMDEERILSELTLNGNSLGLELSSRCIVTIKISG